MRRLLFTALMALLLIDPAAASSENWRAEGWIATDFSRSEVQWQEIQSGGPPKDGIPAIDDPQFASVAHSPDIAPAEPIISVELNGEARAYPLSILIWHEIVNDLFDSTPVVVTFCPLCNSAIVFDRRVDGVTIDFGTTGKLRNSDLVMYDRQTESWWQQFTGTGIVGFYAGQTLTMLPARLEAYSDFVERHPRGKVLKPETPALRDYGQNPYAGYDTSTTPFLYQGDMPKGIEPMARVVLVRKDDAEPVIVALELVRKRGQLDVGGYRISWKAGQTSALDTTVVAKGRDIGTIVVIDKATDALAVYDVVFAFAAHAFYPHSSIITE